MKGIKKRMREASRKMHGHIGRAAAPYVEKAKEHLRINERVEHANQWAEAHPKRFFGYVIGISVVIFGMSLLWGFLPSDNDFGSKQPVISSTEGIGKVINGMREIQRNNERINATIMSARSQGDRLRYELDSLNSLPEKSREDSIAIVRKGKQLQAIINLFENHDKD